MSRRVLIFRSLRFHWRAHLGVLLGATIGSAALIGALLVGDSVRQSLRERALARLGGIYFAMSTGDRFFPNNLPSRLGTGRFSSVRFADKLLRTDFNVGQVSSAVLALNGTASREDGAARANAVNILGVDDRWPGLAHWRVSQVPDPLAYRPSDSTGISARATDSVLPDEVLRRWHSGEIALINETLARKLIVTENDEIIVRIRKPGALAEDAVIAPRANALALRLKIGPVLGPKALGDFSLLANQSTAANVFLPLEILAKQTKLEDKANLVVTAAFVEHTYERLGLHRLKVEIWNRWGRFRGWSIPTSHPGFAPLPASEALSWLQGELQNNWSLADAQLSVRAIQLPQASTGGESVRPFIEITSPRIFLDDEVVSGALCSRSQSLSNHTELAVTNSLPSMSIAQTLVPKALGVLTYLANLIQTGDHSAPYSMVSALVTSALPVGMTDDEILLNEWLAEDLGAKPGDSVQVSYYLADSASRLVERTNSFRVRSIVPIKGLYADRTLMPEFPGIAEAESTHDWDAGFPLTYKIRDKDEAYWKQYRGTPKAFITLAAGQKMWANRFGSLTAIRYEVPPDLSSANCRDAISSNLLANLNPKDFGLRFQPAREQALKAAEQSQDFGQLFLGFSIFLVVAALLLMGLLFQFGLEQRVSEIGILLALGFMPRQVRRLFLLEGIALAFLGGVLGTAAGMGYAKAMIWALTTVWRSAIANSSLQFHGSASTLAIGLVSSVIVGALSIWLTLRKQARQPAVALLAGETAFSTLINTQLQLGVPPAERDETVSTVSTSTMHRPNRPISRLPLSAWLALLSAFGAIALVCWAVFAGETANAGAFFGAGALLLVSGLGFVSFWLSIVAQSSRHRNPAVAHHLTLAGLAIRASGRRYKRSLTTSALLACGSFVILSIGVFRLDATREASRRDSGTGGFALVGQTTLPVVQDLNSKAGREFFGLSEDDLRGVTFVPFRVREGDEASCLNLNRAQKPRVLGIKLELLDGRFTFTKVPEGIARAHGWETLKGPLAPGKREGDASTPVPSVGDANSIQWALGKKIGETLDYADERGQPFKLLLAGAVANSILQGNLIIDEAEFVSRFPSESGYRMFLVDCPSNQAKTVSTTLSRALQDVGLELTPTVERLESFNAVQNTYLGTFQVLGGLGLLLGSAGLGIVVLRNVLERRGELGLLLAVGFRRNALQRLVLWEHAALLGLGLGIGIIAAALAVLPAVFAPATHLPYLSLVLTLIAVLLNGALWTWLATRYALRGNLLEALNNE